MPRGFAFEFFSLEPRIAPSAIAAHVQVIDDDNIPPPPPEDDPGEPIDEPIVYPTLPPAGPEGPGR